MNNPPRKKTKRELRRVALELCAARLNMELGCGWPGELGELEDYDVEDQREALVSIIEEIAFSLRERADKLRGPYRTGNSADIV